MMSSFASDRSSELALQLKCSPSLLNHPPRQPDVVANLKQQLISSSKKSSSNPHEAQSKLSSLLGAVDLRDRFERKRVPNKQLLTALESLVVSVQSSENRAEDGEDVAEIRSILLIQIVLRSYSTLFESLCHQSFGIKDQIDYWSMIENNRISTVYYLVQSIPARSVALASQIWAQTRRAIDQLREDEGHHNRNRLSTWARQLYNQAWARPQQAISFSSLFPILSTNSRLLINSPSHSIQFLSTLSPILLTRQEARVKRKALELVHADLAEKIGGLVNGLHSLEDQAQRPAESDIALSGLVSKMCLVASDLDSQAQQSMDRDNPASMIDQLHQLLSSHLPNHPESLKLRISSLSPPGFFVRNWPWLVSLPVFSYALSSLAYSYRSKILDGFRDAKETLKGFISGWVIRPVEDILQTLRAGQEGTLAIMTKDSLAPELDSLERMVVEFGRDKLKWSEEELSKLSESVKEGNLTSVLKVWEQEIKVKVDLSLAMDGIQSVLRSQSLTFGAIGVAPSMLICFMFGKLFGSLIRQRIGVVGKGTEAVRKEVRIAMRRMERTLLLITSNPSADSDHPTAKSHSNNPERTLGLLFLDLHLLRYFVHSPHFPRRESSRAIQQEFLADIKDLESSQLSWKTKSKLAKRFVKQWGFLVGI
ncbi:Nuclear control of ATPase protein 2 [Puccinia graminis f. sp. tritici]|uniref:Nuclear control of ATPase protein 2 n=1 Tax=Puccinia graminis f. sp. tritici TaxID=56615 RepID=A0A5B0LJY5_PUCGR|nr:Nuclear control of ATPase protein 2 [Puccinia graminis f. sp. tritici]